MPERFPVGPLLDRIAAGFDPISPHERRYLTAHAAIRLNVRREAIYHARKTGLREREADEWAIRAGFHPVEVWPEWNLCLDWPAYRT